MTLLIDELFEGVVFPQKFRIQKSMSLAHFRPWFYKHGNPVDGLMTVQILQNDVLLKEVSLTSTEINEQIPGTFAHGQLRFDFDPLQLNHDSTQEWTEYEVKIFMQNYTNDVNNFYGVVRRYELKFYDIYGNDVIDNEALNDTVEPLGFELFQFTY